MSHHEDQGSEEDSKGSTRGKEEQEGERKGKPQVGRRAFVPPPSCSVIQPARRCSSHMLLRSTFQT